MSEAGNTAAAQVGTTCGVPPAEEHIGGVTPCTTTVAAAAQCVLSDEEQLSLALQFIKSLPDASQYSVKKIRGLLLEQQGVDLPKDVVFRAYATTIAESTPSGLDTDPSGVEDIRAFATAVAEGAPTEDDGDDSGQSDEEDEDAADAEVAALPEEFKSRFGQIVWVYSCKIWWPSYIFHPGKLSRRSELGKRAFRNLGKDYCVYFYGTSGSSEFGFAREKNLRPFDPADAAALEGYRRQKMGKKYQSIFEAGIALATEELKLGPEERVAWKHPVRKPRAPRAIKNSKKAEKGVEKSAKASKGTKPVKIKAPKQPSATSAGGESAAESPMKKVKVVTEEEAEEEDVESPEEEKEEESDTEFGEKKKKAKAKPQERTKKQKVRANDEGGEAPSAKKVKVEDSAGKAAIKKNAEKISTAKKPSAPANKPIVEESSTQRASRLVLLLGMSSAVSPATAESINKTIKTMTKIKDIPLTLDELKSTGAAEAVMALRKHSDNTISVAARQIRDAWKEKFEREAKAEAAAAAATSASAPAS